MATTVCTTGTATTCCWTESTGLGDLHGLDGLDRLHDGGGDLDRLDSLDGDDRREAHDRGEGHYRIEHLHDRNVTVADVLNALDADEIGAGVSGDTDTRHEAQRARASLRMGGLSPKG